MKNVLQIAVLALMLTGFVTSQSSAHTIGEAMTEAATRFLQSLSDEQQAKATFEFNDELRKGWHFIPMERKGLSLKEMKPNQQQLGMALVQSGLSHVGFSKALNVMALEQILHEMENNSPTRDPAKYHFFIFGKPSTKEAWGWRIEGHHLSLSYTVVDGQNVVSTPAFFGANPAHVKEGPFKGLRVLAAEEDLGRQLVRQLSAEQKEKAIISKDAPDDVINGPGREASPLEPAGIAAKDMTEQQKKLLMRLIRTYVNKSRQPLAKVDLKKIDDAGHDNIHFAWAGKLKKGERHYYRIQGPTFIMEYDNTQNGANHIHAVWRDFKGDFGDDVLKKHYDSVPHGNSK
ncbi:MAG: DUF3500 domain-containing protein [Planctomycetales bacterium]|nr:DUF3500 domain-containing protein [Planctomycetales bacterium]